MNCDVCNGEGICQNCWGAFAIEKLRVQLDAAEKRAREAEERLDHQIAKSAMYREALDDIKLWLQNEDAWDVEEDEIHRAIEVALLNPNARAQAVAEVLEAARAWAKAPAGIERTSPEGAALVAKLAALDKEQ